MSDPNEAERHSKPENREALDFLILLTIFVVGILFLLIDNKNNPNHNLPHYYILGHIGMAFVIASVLGATVERLNKSRHDHDRKNLKDILNSNAKNLKKRLGKDVIREVYKRQLPEKLIDAAFVEIFQSNFFRKNWEVSYEIIGQPKEKKDKYDCVRLISIFSYETVNTTKKKKKIPIPIMVDMTSTFFDKSTCGVKFIKIDGVILEKDEIEKFTVKEKSTDSRILLLIEKEIQPGESVSISAHYEQLQPVQSAEFFCSIFPADSVNITAVSPNADFDLSLTSLHQNDPVLKQSSDVMQKWSLGPVLFPGQGIALVWRPKT